MERKEKWFVMGKRADFGAIGEKYGIDQVTARIIRNRDIIKDADIARYLKPELSGLYSPHLMKDMDLLVQILQAGRSTISAHRSHLSSGPRITGLSLLLLLRKLCQNRPAVFHPARGSS